MKRLIIVCEGQTEQEFCRTLLAPHFRSLGIQIEAPTIKRTRGGIVPWSVLKDQVELHLRENAHVTLLIDYYGIKEKHEFPKWEESKQFPSRFERMLFLEEAMAASIAEKNAHRFIPYIQLHEFEGLLFSKFEVFQKNFDLNSLHSKDWNELQRTIEQTENPETINDGPTTAPSKRLLRLIPGYNKVLDGNILLADIGLDTFRSKCTRFGQWIDKLEQI